MQERGRCFSMQQALLSGPVEVYKKMFAGAARNSAGEKGE